MSKLRVRVRAAKLSRSLSSIAEEIDPKENRTAGQPMTEAWITAMKDGMDAYLTSLGE